MAWKTHNIAMDGNEKSWKIPDKTTAISFFANGADAVIAFTEGDTASGGYPIKKGYDLAIEDRNIANVTVYLKATSGSVDIVYADHSLE